jgi:predicted ferric reductase
MTAAETNEYRANLWKVVRVVPENHDINSLYLEGSDEKFRQRRAGQFASLRIMRPDGWSEPHPFTISCAPEDELLRFTIKRIGRFTSAIPELSPGAPVKCTGPLGVFCKDIDAQPDIVMIAGGVGITPFLSVLRHFQNGKAANRVRLFWSNKCIEDVLCTDEIRDMTKVLDLKVIYNLSRDDDVSRHFREDFPRVIFEGGRVSADVFNRYGVSPDAAFFLCGPPPMMDSTLEVLATLGIDQAKVSREKFSW